MSHKRSKREDYEMDIGWIKKKQAMRNPDKDKNQIDAIKIYAKNQFLRQRRDSQIHSK